MCDIMKKEKSNRGPFLQKLCMFTAFTSCTFLFEVFLFKLMNYVSLTRLWLCIPLAVYITETVISKFIPRIRTISVSIEVANIIAFITLFIFVKNECFHIFVRSNIEYEAFFSIILLLVSIVLSKFDFTNNNDAEVQKKQLFNLFYLNTSKAHEIAMLIDNKIMKTIEQEQSFETLFKHHATMGVGAEDKIGASGEYTYEDNSRQRVYENFDVKTTKSIMLKKIYETAAKRTVNVKELTPGDLVLFKDIELQQTNVDDTVMILNVLQDSKIKDQANDSVEINVNKMMDRMLDDFTIDYTFEYPVTEIVYN